MLCARHGRACYRLRGLRDGFRTHFAFKFQSSGAKYVCIVWQAYLCKSEREGRKTRVLFKVGREVVLYSTGAQSLRIMGVQSLRTMGATREIPRSRAGSADRTGHTLCFLVLLWSGDRTVYTRGYESHQTFCSFFVSLSRCLCLLPYKEQNGWFTRLSLVNQTSVLKKERVMGGNETTREHERLVTFVTAGVDSPSRDVLHRLAVRHSHLWAHKKVLKHILAPASIREKYICCKLHSRLVPMAPNDFDSVNEGQVTMSHGVRIGMGQNPVHALLGGNRGQLRPHK